jgi:2-methylcitrate dehydratase PrpD
MPAMIAIHTEPRTAAGIVASLVGSLHVPEEARLEAVRCVVDTMAVMLPGGADPSVRMLEGALSPSAGGVPSFWTGARYSSADAATLYGMAAHMLDYDDVCMLTICHPSAPVLSALLAAQPWDTIDTRAFLDAFVIGTEVGIRLGETMGFEHYRLGFHATSTLGTVGAAAACARLLQLTPAQTINALSIAGSMSSGLRKNFGSMVKPLHVGIAAANGLRAARFARAGMEGASGVFEDGGFLGAFSGGQTERWPNVEDLGRPFAIVSPGFERKRYPCCYMLHKMLDATIMLAREHDVDLQHVTGVCVDMPPGGSKPLIHDFPHNGLEARFSAPYAVLCGILDQRMDLGLLGDAAVLRPHVQSRLHLVRVVERDEPPLDGGDIEKAPVTVSLGMDDGRELTCTKHVTPGSPDDPLTDSDLIGKWKDCVGLLRGGSFMESTPRQLLEMGDRADLGAWLVNLHDRVTRPNDRSLK